MEVSESQSCGQTELDMALFQLEGEMWLRRVIEEEVQPDYLVSICLPSVSPIFH